MRADDNTRKILISLAEAAVNLFIALILLSSLIYLLLVLIFGVDSLDGLRNFATASKEVMISLLIIVGGVLILAFLAMFIGWLCKDQEGIMILPFEVPLGEEKYSGKALSHLLTSELLRIDRIRSRKYKGITPIEPEDVNVPIVKPSSENITTEIAKIGTLEAGNASLPLGQILVSLKRLWPWGSKSTVISGCLQKYGSTIALTACLEHQNMKTWEVKDIDKSTTIGDEIIPDLAKDLAFMIVYELSVEENTDKKVNAKTWRGFKHFFEALEAYDQYNHSNNDKCLERARIECLKAANSETGYGKLLKLLYNLGMEYSNKKELNKAEELLFLAYEIRPDDNYALIGLGHLYVIQHLYQKALEYFVRATETNPESCVAWYNKGRALFHLSRYEEALEASKKAIELDPKDALSWGSKGGALTMLNRNEEALEACEKAIKLDPNLAMAWSNKCVALDRLKREEEALETRKRAAELKLKSATIYIPLAHRYRKQKREIERVEACKLARNFIEKESEYNRACFEAVCGSPDATLELLRTAFVKDARNADWARQDPDFEFIRDDPKYKERFEALLDEFSPGGEGGPK